MNVHAESRVRWFPATSWTLLGEAGGEGSRAEAARNAFAERYHRPVLAYLAAIVRDRDRARDLSQGFFADVVPRGRLYSAENRGPQSFRKYLKSALRRYLRDDFRRRQAIRRPPSEAAVRPDAESRGWEGLALATTAKAESAFDSAYVRSLLADATRRVEEICKEKNQTVNFALFRQRFLNDSDEAPSWRQIGEPFGLGQKVARARTVAVAGHFRQVLQDLVREEAGAGRSPEEEIRSLLRVLAEE